MNRPTFSTLRELVLGLGFQDHSVPGKFHRFDHPEPDTWLLMRDYRPDDPVSQADLLRARVLLDYRGIMSAERFDELMRERPVAS